MERARHDGAFIVAADNTKIQSACPDSNEHGLAGQDDQQRSADFDDVRQIGRHHGPGQEQGQRDGTEQIRSSVMQVYADKPTGIADDNTDDQAPRESSAA